MVSDGMLSVLQISTVKDSDFATYNCSAHNAYGAAHLPITFSVKTGAQFTAVATSRLNCLFVYFLLIHVAYTAERKRQR